jgi:ABC-type polysaccharide/polyol phosphate export permease
MEFSLLALIVPVALYFAASQTFRSRGSGKPVFPTLRLNPAAVLVRIAAFQIVIGTLLLALMFVVGPYTGLSSALLYSCASCLIAGVSLLGLSLIIGILAPYYRAYRGGHG